VSLWDLQNAYPTGDIVTLKEFAREYLAAQLASRGIIPVPVVKPAEEKKS
jgi:hypothetical protein